MRNWRFYVLGLSAAALIALASAGIATAANSPSVGGTLDIGVSQEAVGLDPNIVTAFSSFTRTQLMYNTLVRYDADANIVPDLASSWEIEDPTTYVFHLREGVLFHNGRELTAEDVKYTMERILDPETGSPGASYLAPIEAIETPDRYTVVFHLKYPAASFLDALTSGNTAIVPKEAVEANGNLQRVVVGTGPFMLEEWRPDDVMVLVKNPNYFRDGQPYLDEVVFHVIPEERSLLAGLQSGSLDMATIAEGSILRLVRSASDLNLVQTPSLNVRTFGFNTTVEPFDDPLVRRAISLAIDQQQIIQLAEFGNGQPTGPVPVGVKTFAADPSALPYYNQDIEKAKELLAEAGYPNGFTFDILTANSYEGGIDVAQVIQSQLKQIGITANLDVVEWGIYVDRWVKRDFEAMVELKGGGADPDRLLYRMLHSDGGVNNFVYEDAELDQLLEAGQQETDLSARQQIYAQVQHRIAEQAPVIFLYTGTENQVLRPNVHGFVLVPNGALYYLEQTWVE